MVGGLLDLSVAGYVVATLLLTHVTIVSITVFLHRHQAHRALDLHPVASHFFRLWLWLTTGIVTAEWVAVHRKHHAHVETEDDPHSPQVEGISELLLAGTELYRNAARDPEVVARYGHGCPDDWLERHVYGGRGSHLGYAVMLAIDLALFGVAGLTVWAIQMMWSPVFACGIINGLGHYWGYRNYETADAATNLTPLAIIIGGEELHNNHHAYPNSAKLSSRSWEFDIGWLYIRLLAFAGLARVKRVAPALAVVPGKAHVDLDTVTAVITNRMQVMATYAGTVLARVHDEEMRRASASVRRRLGPARALLARGASPLTPGAEEQLELAFTCSDALKTAYQFKQRLQAIWQERTASQERLAGSLQTWCRQAEATGIRALQEFARTIPGYATAPA